MPLPDTLWFLPFEAAEGTLQSVYAADPATELAGGQPFTLALEAVKLAKAPHESIFERIVHPDHDVLILSSSALGAKPPVERVHYYKANIDLERPLLVHDLLSDAICVCDDYNDGDALYLELKVVTMETAGQHRDAALKGFETLLSTAGSVFPVFLPYAAFGSGALAALGKVWEAVGQRETWRISEPIRFFPPKTKHAKTLRQGRYVVFSDEVDGTQYQLSDSCQLEGRIGENLSYAVFRIDPSREPSIDYVISQRVATLLTQLRNDQEGQPAGMLETSLGYLTDTLKAYTNFTDLQRYQELLAKGSSRTSAEESQLQKIASRPELQPFLPKQ